jgi:hypothetical protein
MRVSALVCVAALASAPLSASAQLSPAPELGLWETKSQLLIDGRDLMADMRNAQAEMMSKMPPAQRAQMEAALKANGGGSGGGVERDCVTAKDLADWTNPTARLREMEEDAPTCKFQPVSSSGATLQFKGRCNDPQGFSGDVAGSFTMNGPRAWTTVYTGKGKMADAAVMGQKAAGGAVDMRVESSGRWLAASCGAVK